MNQSSQLEYINEADQEQITALDGIGPALAERILANRPFSKLDGLLEVNGIGNELLAKIKVELQSQTAEDSTRPRQDNDTDQLKKASQKEEKAVAETDPDKKTPAEQQLSPPPSPEYLSKKQAFWWIITSVLFSIVLTIAITLGVLKGLNSGLKYPTTRSFAQLQQELDSLSLRVDGLAKDTRDLRNRVDNLNSIAERMDQVEGLTNEMEQDLDELDIQLGEIQQQSDNFLTFFQELSQSLTLLLESLEVSHE